MTADDLYGTWRLLSLAQRVVSTGERIEAFGKAPRGLLSYHRDGRMYAIIAKDPRSKPRGVSRPSAAEIEELFDSMYAYAGTFTFDGKKATHHVDISWDESWTGTDQVRHIRLERGQLHISTDPAPEGTDERMIVWELVWERVRP